MTADATSTPIAEVNPARPPKHAGTPTGDAALASEASTTSVATMRSYDSGMLSTSSSSAALDAPSAEDVETARLVEECAEAHERIQSAYAALWGRLPLLQPVDGGKREETGKALDGFYARACEAAPYTDTIAMPGNAPASPGSTSSAGKPTSGEMLRENWEYLKALDRQLCNSVASFAGKDVSFSYSGAYEVAREWNGTVLEFRAPKPILKSRKGLTKEQYGALIGVSQWIRGAVEGAMRVLLLSLEAMETPHLWQKSLTGTAMEQIGLSLYNELSVDEKFNPEALADREYFFGADYADEKVKTSMEASAVLDLLEKAEAIWNAKLRDQQVVDSLQSVKGWGYGVRSKALSKRIRNSSSYRRTIYARYPDVELTSLQQMKIKTNADLALSSLASYASALIKVASSLRDRAMDVVDAHHRILDEENPLRKRPKSIGFMEYMLQGASKTREFAYEFTKSIEKSLDDSLSLVGAGGNVRGCCVAMPNPSVIANRAPAAIHYVSESDSDDDP